MTFEERSRHINRIIAGFYKLDISGDTIFLQSPTAFQKWMAEEIFFTVLRTAEDEGAFTEDQLLDFLEKQGIYSLDDQHQLEERIKNVDDYKVGLYNTLLKSNDHKMYRNLLTKSRQEINRLETLKHAYDHLSCQGIASTAKQRYLLCCSITDEQGNSLSSYEQPDYFSDHIMLRLQEYRLDESDIRELSRNEPWVSIWSVRGHCGGTVFNVASSSELTDEQKALLIWSGFYENAREHPEYPGDKVLDDDDVLDGWRIIQSREREKQLDQKIADGLLNNNNDKISSATEVFHVAQSMDDIRRLYNMNDPMNRSVINSRLQTIKGNKDGVAEQNLPDVRAKIQRQSIEQYSNMMKSK
jgi:hypothetical protein